MRRYISVMAREKTESTSARTVARGLVFPEVPRWHDGQLWLCDFQLGLPGATGQVLVLEADGTPRIVVDKVPGGPPTGLSWLPDGKLLVVASQGQALLTPGPGGRPERYADLSSATQYGCNEVVTDAAGRAYVGTSQVPPDPDTLTELLIVHPDGRIEVADRALRFPNGLMITPDGGTLIAAESTGHRLTAYSIAGDGSLRNKREWAPLPGIVPDGPCLDAEGCVWCANAVGRECLRVAPGGEILQRVSTEQDAFACALGGVDGKTLFICTSVNPFMPGPRTDFGARPRTIVAVTVDVPGQRP